MYLVWLFVGLLYYPKGYLQPSISPKTCQSIQRVLLYSISARPSTHPLINHPSIRLFYHSYPSLYTVHLFKIGAASISVI